MDTIIKLLRKIRGLIVRSIKKKEQYLSGKSLDPISKMYGFDRGKPIDRYFIENFLEENKQYIKGRCLEIVDNQYTLKYGTKKVLHSDVLDIFQTKKANIHGDLRNLFQVKDNKYDCCLVTQTFNVIDDYNSAIKECFRILKPGGILLATIPTISPCWNLKINLWRFSQESALFVFGKNFGIKNTQVKGYGNHEAIKGFWIGLASEDLSFSELTNIDESLPLIIGVKAQKKKGSYES